MGTAVTCLPIGSILSLKNITYNGQELPRGLEEWRGTGRKFWKEEPGPSWGTSREGWGGGEVSAGLSLGKAERKVNKPAEGSLGGPRDESRRGS